VALPDLVSTRGLFYRHDGTELPYPDLPRTYSRFVISEARWSVLPTGERPCNDALSIFGDPPSSGGDGRGARFACVVEQWRDSQ
jgi:hypothetical protein